MAWRNGVVTAVVGGCCWRSSSRARAAERGRLKATVAIKLNCEQGPCDQVARGRAAFNDGNLKALGGNGRACADCHMPSEQLSALACRRARQVRGAAGETRSQQERGRSAVPAGGCRRLPGERGERQRLLQSGRQRARARHASVAAECPTARSGDGPANGRDRDRSLPRGHAGDERRDHRDRMASLPIWPPAPRVPILGVDPNGPNRQGGYQHDARFATLQEQARGALIAHAQVSVEPPSDMLDDLAAFQQTLFSSPGVERLAEAIASGSTPFPDPDPELTEIEQQGKAVFNRACATCHGGSLHPSGSTPEAAIVRPIVRYHNIQTACPRPATDGYLPCPPRLGARTRARIESRSPMARRKHSQRRIRDDCCSLARSPISE